MIKKFIVRTSDELQKYMIYILNTVYALMIGTQIFIVFFPFSNKLKIRVIITAGFIGMGLLFSLLVYIAFGRMLKKITEKEVPKC